MSRQAQPLRIFLDTLEAGDGEPQDERVLKQAPGLVSFERRLEVMSMPQLTRVLGRYAPSKRVTTRAAAAKAIKATLASPDLLAALISGLSPFERMVLEELKRRGGKASGWQVFMAAVLHGADPGGAAEDGAASPNYQRYGPSSTAASELMELYNDGLLQTGWVHTDWSRFGYSSHAEDMVGAPPQLLNRLQPRPRPPVTRLNFEPAGEAVLEARHPAAIVLELLDVLQLVAREGGLHVTRTDSLAKPFLKRLHKARPELGDRLEPLLLLLPKLGFVQEPRDDSVPQPWPLDPSALAAFLDRPLRLMYASLVNASAVVNDPDIAHAWAYSRYGTSSIEPLWMAVLQSLPVLPDHAVPVEAAANGLWIEVLVKAFGGRTQEWRKNTNHIDLLERLLAETLPSIGLLATGTKGGDAGEQVPLVAPAAGAAWYAEARALLEGASQRPGTAWAEDEQQLAASAPALLIQPNFEILAYLDLLTSSAVRALSCAAIQRLDAQTATFLIDRNSVTHALDSGMDASEVLSQLEHHAHDLPLNVADAIRDWAGRRDRLKIHVATRLIEYPDESTRNASLKHLEGARALAERFVLIDESAPEPQAGVEQDYRHGVEPALKVRANGTIRVNGPVNLAARTVLKQLTTQEGKHTFRISEDAVRTPAFRKKLHTLLQAQAIGGIPRELAALLAAWSGQAQKPVVAPAILFQHPEAGAWAANPKFSGLLGTQLSPSTYLVAPGKEAALQKLLDDLGVGYRSDWTEGGPAVGTIPGEGALETGLSTRKTREALEAAIEAGHHVELRYAPENVRYTRRGYSRRNPGKVRTELLIPESISYEGSTPYLDAMTANRKTERYIRIGYIEAIGVRAAST